MTVITICTLLTVFSFDAAKLISGSNGYTVNSALNAAPAKSTVTVEPEGTGLRVAMVVTTLPYVKENMAKAYNDSFIKIRFRQDYISWPNDTYTKKSYYLKTSKCDISAESELTGSLKARQERGTPAICPTDKGVLGGRFQRDPPLDYWYLRASVDTCAKYCGQEGEISCDACAPQAELNDFLNNDIEIAFYFQQTVNVITEKVTWVLLPQTFYLSLGVTPMVEVYVQKVISQIRNKWRYGFSDEGTRYKEYVKFSSSNERQSSYAVEKSLAQYYLHNDPHTEAEETQTPYTLLEMVSSLGGLSTALAVLFGTVGTAGNCLMNDDDAVHAASDAYIASVAWGDVESCAEFARELRQAQLPGQAFCRSHWWKVYERKKRQFNELQHFRKIMMELIEDPKYAHLDPRDKLHEDTMQEFEEKHHVRSTAGGMGYIPGVGKVAETVPGEGDQTDI